jgi:dCMP deaminase
MTPSWDHYFLNMVRTVSTKSKDPHTQIGCVIVGPDREIRTTGYNSFVRGLNDCVPERQERPEKYWWIEHAERNAIYNAARMGTSLNNCTIYIPSLPCVDCARAIVSVGIREVVNSNQAVAAWVQKPQWQEHIERTQQMFAECGVTMRGVDFEGF